MLTSSWRRWLRRKSSARKSERQPVLRLERLEARDVPSSATYGGTVTASSQSYNHPTANGAALSGQAVAFQAMAFRVSTDDTYTLTNVSNTFSAPSAGDGFFALYQTSFNPSNPLTNLVAANDSGGGSLGLKPQITQELVPGTTYFLITSPATGGSVGDFIDQISSSSNDTYTFNTHSVPAVDSPILTAVTGTSATLGGVVEGDGGAAVTDRGVVYSINSTNGMPIFGGNGVTKLSIGSGVGSFMSNVTGLALGTTYAFRAYATNAVGTFYTSPVTTFVADTPPTIGGMISTPQNILDTSTVQSFILATVTDPDSPPQTETVSVIYPAANGSFTQLGGFTGSAGDYTMSGSAAAVQTALRGLTFVPTKAQVAAGQSVTTNFTVTVADGFTSTTDSETTVVATASGPTSGPTVGNVQVNDGNAQRSEVESLTVTFSGPVTFLGGDANAVNAFQLKHLTDSINVGLNAAVSTNGSGQTVVTLTFYGPETDYVSALNGASPSLADGRYSLTVFSADVSSGGQALNGGTDYVSPTDTSGGGPGQLHLYRLYGDATGNGYVDASDLGVFRTTYNTVANTSAYLWYLDADGGGAVDATSLGQFRLRYNTNVF